MKNRKSIAVMCSLLLMGPAVLNMIQHEVPVMAVEEDEQANIVRNGDFSEGTEHWTILNDGGEASFTTVDNQALVTVHSIAGMHPDWGIPVSWSSQFNQMEVPVEANQRYQLTFEAKSSVERPVVVEFDRLAGRPQAEFIFSEDMQTFTYEFNTMQAGTLDFKFLIGNVHHSGLTTPEEEHTLTFDHVTIQSLGDIEDDSVERDWQLTWSDEFEGDGLDLTKWRIDEGNGFWNDDVWEPGWGNNEKQYYHEDNVTVEDGKLILEAREEQRTDQHGTYEYTSGKILSDGLFSQTYGRFEASMKLPEGQGYWPAFWMMPQDDTYGTWASSGELDIMENRGSEIDKVGGAIHYGGEWPLNTHSASEYTFTGDNRTTDFNTYSVEWEPDEIRWYVNDDLYWRTSDWHSEGGYYPAPFNQDFHVILNLAVGGWYGGEPDATTEFPAQVEVDYVRVYEDANADYDKSATPILDEDDENNPEPGDELDRDPANWQAIGDNLVEDGTFEETVTFGDPDNLSTWNTFNLGDHDPNAGFAEFSVIDEVLNVDIQQVGWNWWQIQLFQNIMVPEGTYLLSFDMASELERDMRVELVESGEAIQIFSVDENENTYEFILHVDEEGEYSLMFGFGRESNEAELDVPYNMTLDNVSFRAAELIEDEDQEPGDPDDEEEPDDDTDPEGDDDPAEGETPGDEDERDDLIDSDDDDPDPEDETTNPDDTEADSEDDTDEQISESDEDESADTESTEVEGERLPQTATALWTVGALGVTGLVSGLGIKYFKRK